MYLLFDLDGTLTDSLLGISRCVNHALAAVGHSEMPAESVRPLVGRPLAALFGLLLNTTDGDLISCAMAAYRDRFDRVGVFENSLYPGIVEALEVFTDQGHTLGIVTAKPAPAAFRVASHFNISRYFQTVHGLEVGVQEGSKADLLKSALTGQDIERTAMIGDHVDDVRAARSTGVRAVAVGWGYGRISDLREAEPDFLAERIADLVSWVRSAG